MEIEWLKYRLIELNLPPLQAQELTERVKDIPLSNKQEIHNQVTQVIRCYAGAGDFYKAIIDFKKQETHSPRKEWLSHFKSMEKFQKNHVIIVRPDKEDDLFAVDLNGCCYGIEDDILDLSEDENCNSELKIKLWDSENFVNNYNRENPAHIRRAIGYAEELRSQLDDSFDVWCDAHLDWKHNGREKKPFRIEKQKLVIKEYHPGSSYFWIGPVKVHDIPQFDSDDGIEEFNAYHISIDEDILMDYLYPILEEKFKPNLPENQKRINSYGEGFDPYGDNFYSFPVMEEICARLKKIMLLMQTDFWNQGLDKFREGWTSILFRFKEYDEKYTKMSPIQKYRATEKHKDEIIGFYKRFIWYMKKFIADSQAEGFKVMLFAGP